MYSTTIRTSRSLKRVARKHTNDHENVGIPHWERQCRCNEAARHDQVLSRDAVGREYAHHHEVSPFPFVRHQACWQSASLLRKSNTFIRRHSKMRRGIREGARFAAQLLYVCRLEQFNQVLSVVAAGK